MCSRLAWLSVWCGLLLSPLAIGQTTQTTLFSDDFETGLSNWVVDQSLPCGFYSCNPQVTWQTIDNMSSCASWSLPFANGTHVAWFGNLSTCTFQGGPGTAPRAGLVMSQWLPLPAGSNSIALRFRTKSDGEDNGWDVRDVSLLVQGQSTPAYLGRLGSSDWHVQVFDLTPWAGSSVKLRLDFDTGDPFDNDRHGWYVDDVRVETSSITGVAYCFGDGSGTPCPCGNAGASGNGCATSFNPAGARLIGAGTPSLSLDSLVLDASGMSSSIVTFIQGASFNSFFTGGVFGDGLRCVYGTVIRLRAGLAAGGARLCPTTGEPPISILGGVLNPPGTRVYQVWFRDSDPTFCTGETFNLTNGLIVTWRP